MRNWYGSAAGALLLALATVLGVGCTPGYMKASDLEARGQGPSACAKSCEDINMRMAAIVLVGDQLPGCVCQPLNVQGAPAKSLGAAPTESSMLDEGASASTTGYVVLAAAAAAREQQRQQQQMQQQHNKKH